MPIVGTAPVTVPQVVYDIWWMQRFRVDAPDPTKKVTAVFTLVPQNSGTGAIDISRSVTVSVPDVMAQVGSDADVASAFAAVLLAVQKLAKAQNKI